ncbi:frataxin [Stella humosa]|uniref:Frataxin n=1 Tax=Stella humosa TaxID=94 RepID=A0A3N1LKL3_9PROT|nr:iron donor protein CyaY [Stella humosa]ROP91279.1 frataxin [Stella humosa]BBK34367.1 protein CyaY [Stella humosa]
MAIDERTFSALAERTLRHLMDAIEGACPDADCELRDGILTIEVDDTGTFVVNKHAPNREIWLSSPRSGAWHFAPDEAGGRWVSTRGNEVLEDVLSADLGVAIPAAAA